ncbi:MAG TPA: cupin domain-containing protein [Terracidiphilus sp.]|jgi:mannose-6-phosphate isomerase-like protein (cupin superfamily)
MKKGQSVGNRHTGETLTMLVSEEDNDGTLQLYRVHLPPHRPSPPLHYHLELSETFTALEGTLDMYLGRERKHIRLTSGESVTAQIGQLHTFANNSDQPCTMTVETRPAGDVVKAFQVAYGVANDGGASPDGLHRNPLIRLRFVEIAEGFLPFPPLPLQRFVLRVAHVISLVTGVERQIQRYISD